jgi:hypothetical protein
MIQFSGVSPFAINTGADSPLLTSASQAVEGGFQSQLSAALTATLQTFGINPNSVSVSIAPIVSGNAPSAAPAATPASAGTPVSNGDGTLASQDPILSFDDAYWSNQPPAVQALRNIDDPAQRAMAAAQLAASGYTIDTPIMVWGWDPSKVTTLRQDMGYTWVPSAFQNPVPAAPGLSNGSEGYDPSHPPTGSIAV